MRKIIFTLFLFLTAIELNAQIPERLTVSTSIGTGIAMSTPTSTSFTWQLAGHYNINSRFSAGIGTGLSFYEKILIPLFADAKFFITKPHRFTPYLECGIGYSFAPGKHANGGLYFNPAIGIQYAILKNKKLFFSLGYELQKLERLKTYRNNLLTAEFAEELNHNSISIKVGILW